MLLLLATILGTASAYNLTCHCQDKNECSANGFCKSGCEEDWYGPGCQLGNVAFNKTAEQSSTHIDGAYSGDASLAVDGLLPGRHPEMSATFCSHTAPLKNISWWYVTLSTTHYFAVTRVTLVNRNDKEKNTNERLRNFTILYSNETEGDPDPNNATWNEYAREPGTIHINKSYHSDGIIIAKRIAVYLLYTESPILTLCEVKVFGYLLEDCPVGFTGPACLLRACDQQCSISGGICDGEYGNCRYGVCPDRSLLPPDCWITLSNYLEVEIQSDVTCDAVIFLINISDSQPNVAAFLLQLHVDNHLIGTHLVNTTLSVPEDKRVYFNYSYASAGATYNVSVLPMYCNITNHTCLFATGSKTFTSVIGKRDYWPVYEKGCLLVKINSTTTGCELPTAVKINCMDKDTGETKSTQTSPLCGLDEGHTYECSARATIDATNNKFENLTFIFVARTETKSPTTENITGIVAGSIVGPVVLIVVISIAVVIYSRRKRIAKRNVPGSIEDATGAHAKAKDDDQRSCRTSGITLLQYQQYVLDEVLLTRKFSELQARAALPCTIGKDAENKEKNRFKNILPYDFNRVRLDRAGSNYINASYIRGFVKTKEFIATQGPSSKTVDDFWLMLWQENCSVIIMLTDYVEHAKKKCEKYFPTQKSSTTNIEVQVCSTVIYDTHTVSILDVRNGSEIRKLRHFHFLAWPDQSVPTHNAEVLLFYSRICRHLKLHPSQGPVIVHCSAGAGRTGTYLAFDYLLQRYKSESLIDVNSTVANLRDQRMLMVQTKDQFLFLHKAFLYAIKTSRYIYEANQLTALSHPDKCQSTSLAVEWKDLQKLLPKFHVLSYGASALPENRCKNRQNDILALDSKRPIILLPDGSSQLYINAVYCNGCYSSRQFIATQMPLKGTVADFWIMVYHTQPSCIILLHDLPTGDDENFPRYLPEPGHSITASWLEVKCCQDRNEGDRFNLMMPSFDISLSAASGIGTSSKIVSTKLFTASLWDVANSSEELPASTIDFVTAARALGSYCHESPQQPVIVQCRDGVTRSGLFLSAVNALHRFIETEQVFVFQTVDLLRSCRPEFVTNEAQYRFIYKILDAYRESSNIYANT